LKFDHEVIVGNNKDTTAERLLMLTEQLLMKKRSGSDVPSPELAGRKESKAKDKFGVTTSKCFRLITWWTAANTKCNTVGDRMVFEFKVS